MHKFILSALTFALLSGCSLLPDPYKAPVAQGNVIKQEQVDQLEIGMTESQVRYLVGTPMIQNTFTPNEWRYHFSSEYADDSVIESEIALLILTFKNGVLTNISNQ